VRMKKTLTVMPVRPLSGFDVFVEIFSFLTLQEQIFSVSSVVTGDDRRVRSGSRVRGVGYASSEER